MEVGTNIRKIRELKGFSQEFMSQQLELSQRQFSRIENNETDVSLSKLEKIGEILEVSLTQILGFDERFIFQNRENAFGYKNTYNAFSEKEREQYEKRIAQLEGENLFLRNQMEALIGKR